MADTAVSRNGTGYYLRNVARPISTHRHELFPPHNSPLEQCPREISEIGIV
jgi:hypothetical protein